MMRFARIVRANSIRLSEVRLAPLVLRDRQASSSDATRMRMASGSKLPVSTSSRRFVSTCAFPYGEQLYCAYFLAMASHFPCLKNLYDIRDLSFTSVLRPGTFFTCAALASTNSNSPSDKMCHTGCQRQVPGTDLNLSEMAGKTGGFWRSHPRGTVVV